MVANFGELSTIVSGEQKYSTFAPRLNWSSMSVCFTREDSELCLLPLRLSPFKLSATVDTVEEGTGSEWEGGTARGGPAPLEGAVQPRVATLPAPPLSRPNTPGPTPPAAPPKSLHAPRTRCVQHWAPQSQYPLPSQVPPTVAIPPERLMHTIPFAVFQRFLEYVQVGSYR